MIHLCEVTWELRNHQTGSLVTSTGLAFVVSGQILSIVPNMPKDDAQGKSTHGSFAEVTVGGYPIQEDSR